MLDLADYSENKEWTTIIYGYKEGLKTELSYPDGEERILSLLNNIPKQISFYQDKLRLLTDFIYEHLLVPTEIKLEERTDSWLADRRDEIAKEVSALKRQDEALKSERDDIDQELRRRFDERGTTGTQTSRFTLILREDDNYPEVYDRTEFEDYVLRTKKIHLLQKRLSMSSVQEELMALRDECQALKDELNASQNKEETAAALYEQLHKEDEHVSTKIDVLRKSGMLVAALEEELESYFSIPGVQIVTKYSINSKKRGNK